MGEYAEMALEREMDFPFEFKPRAKKDFSVWKCRDGKTIKLTEMDDRHLRNTLSMLRAKDIVKFGDWIAAMERELRSRALPDAKIT